MVKATKLFTAFVACRDSWEEEDSAASPRNATFKPFCSWVMKAYAEDNPAATALLNLIVSPFDASLYSAQDLSSALDKNTYARAFRIALGADASSEDKDFRVRRLLEAILAGNLPFHPYALLCPFFTDTGRGRSKTKNAQAGEDGPGSRFEKLLFLSANCILATIKEHRPVKRRRIARPASEPATETVSDIRIPSLTFRDPIPQRIGSTIKAIVRSWDVFAEHVGLKSAESMVLPYVLCCVPTAEFTVLTRDQGFAPKNLFEDVDVFSKQSTHIREETYEEAYDRPENIDLHCRAFTAALFSDIHIAIKSDSLFSLPEGKQWDPLKRFSLTDGSLPARFATLEPVAVAAVKAYHTATSATLQQDESAALPASVTFSSVNEPVNESNEALRSDDIIGQHVGAAPTTEKMLSDLESALVPNVRMHHCPFSELIETDEAMRCGPIEGAVQLVLTDPPYNVRRERTSDPSAASYDNLSIAEMASVVQLVASLLRPGGHAVVFCTVQQFAHWARLFGEHKTGNNKTFSVTKPPFVFCNHPDAHNGFPGRASCALQNSLELAVHLKKNGVSFDTASRMVNYRNFGFVKSRFPGYKNIVDNVPKLLPGEQVRQKKEGHDGTSGSISTTALRPEQKSLALLQELVSRFSQSGDLVVDLFAGTFSTAVACFTLPHHRRFVGCEMDGSCYEKAVHHTLARFAEALVNGKTTVPLDPSGEQAARVMRNTLILPAMDDQNWRAPVDLPQYQRFPTHIAAFLANRWADSSVFRLASTAPLHKWKHTLQARFQALDVDDLRAADATASGVFISPSTINNPNSGLGLFAARTFQPGDQVCFFFGTLVYHNLYHRTETTKSYGDGMMAVNVDRFRQYALQVGVAGGARDFAQVRDRSDGRKAVFIVPSPFAAAAYINDYQYWAGDKDRDAGIPLARKPNVIYVPPQAGPISKADELLSSSLIVVEACDLINPGQEIFVHYNK